MCWLLSIGKDKWVSIVERHFENGLNEIRFSNIFIEKRISHFLKALQLQGFFCLCFFNGFLKKQKMQKQGRNLDTAFS